MSHPGGPGFFGGFSPELTKQYLTKISIQQRLSLALGVIVFVTILLRSYVKARLLRVFRTDDAFMVVASIVFEGVVATSYVINGNGMTLLTSSDPAAIMHASESLSEYAVSYNALFALCSISSKVSLAISMLVIFGHYDRWQRASIYVLTAISTILGFIFFGLCFTCGITAVRETDKADCPLVNASNMVGLVWACANMATDVIFAFLCLHIIWKGNMPTRTKVIAGGLLCLGSVGAVAAVFRFVTYLGYGYTELYDQRLLINRYSFLEVGTCIIAACLATLRPLFRRMWDLTSYGSSVRRGGEGESSEQGRRASEVVQFDEKAVKFPGLKATVMKLDAEARVGATAGDEPHRPGAGGQGITAAPS